MKILVLELARLGDVYMSWPALRALRRQYPTAEIDVMVRPRFAESLKGLDAINQVLELPTESLLAPLLGVNLDLEGAVEATSQFVDKVRSSEYDWIINLTFSPASSTLARLLSTATTQVSGYTRHEDGYLWPSDEASLYFYAQVGIGKWNRFHLSSLFAEVTRVPLIESDWRGPDNLVVNQDREALVVHIGASEQHKTLSEEKWQKVLAALCEHFSKPIVLIGSSAESALAERIVAGLDSSNVSNRVGHTSLRDTFEIISRAQMVLGGDSAPMHMASLVKTPCVNLSIGQVNFWETGPLAPGSVILRADEEANLSEDKIVAACQSVIEQKSCGDFIYVVSDVVSYRAPADPMADFSWSLILALYTDADFPLVEVAATADGMVQLWEMNSVILHQLERIERGVPLENLLEILKRGDEIINLIAKVRPELSPIVDWFHSLKIKIPPGTQEQVLVATMDCHNQLQSVLNVYCGRPTLMQEEFL